MNSPSLRVAPRACPSKSAELSRISNRSPSSVRKTNSIRTPHHPQVERNPFDDTYSKFAALQRQGLVRPVYSSRDGMEGNRVNAGSRRWDIRPSWHSAVYSGKRPSGKAESVVSPWALLAHPVKFDENGSWRSHRLTRTMTLPT